MEKIRNEQINQENKVNEKIEILTNLFENEFDEVQIDLKNIRNTLKLDTRIEDYFLKEIKKLK